MKPTVKLPEKRAGKHSGKQAAHAALRESSGAICAVASASAELVAGGLTGYSSSKAALVMLIKQMAYEWGPDGIRANAVSPGITHSRSTEAQWEDEELVRYRTERLPLRRLGRSQDIAQAVAFLVGPRSSYVTGENLAVDGGLRHIAMEYVRPPDDYLTKLKRTNA
ncbi:SDR family NAD(P)-dependent oxidoreductase [Frankia sp. Cr2]|uniref:SDR family NAD(P)-dependent oxidoreductase n=1 Tax=Frankia sp. Cr2 TaxID=3073932 RepID=UPI002AD55498|nr:SDR family oxidoreductase [Frankia sp. Cr2]